MTRRRARSCTRSRRAASAAVSWSRRKPMDPVIEVALRGGLALLFLVAALHKARDLPGFHATLANYRLLPPRATWPAALVVVGGELVATATLLLDSTVGAVA